MVYDLHGIWDAAVPNVCKYVYGQTNMHEIEKDLLPLWYDLSPSDMSKVNLGIARYGRGYTFADPSCSHRRYLCLDSWEQAGCLLCTGRCHVSHRDQSAH
jgi:GH18 family chitinase